MIRLALVVMLVLEGCTCDGTTVDLNSPPTMATTTTAFARLEAKTCYTFAFNARANGNLGGDTRCNTEGVEVAEAWVDDPALFEVAPSGTTVQVTALGEGTSMLHARAGGSFSGQVYDAPVEALRPNRMSVSISSCDAGQPWAINTGARFFLNVAPFAGDRPLNGEPTNAVTVPFATRVAPGQWEASPTPLTSAITSDFDRSLNLAVRVFSVSEATLVVLPSADQFGVGTATFTAQLAVAGANPCVDSAVRIFESLTPAECNFGPDSDGGARLVQRTLSSAVVRRTRPDAGTCTLRVSVEDHPVPAPVEIDHVF